MKIERGDRVQHRRGGSEGTAMHDAEDGTVNVKVKSGIQAWAFADTAKVTPAAETPAAASPLPAQKKKSAPAKKKAVPSENNAARARKKAAPAKKKAAKKKSK